MAPDSLLKNTNKRIVARDRYNQTGEMYEETKAFKEPDIGEKKIT